MPNQSTHIGSYVLPVEVRGVAPIRRHVVTPPTRLPRGTIRLGLQPCGCCFDGRIGDARDSERIGDWSVGDDGTVVEATATIDADRDSDDK